jgi:hypothetical protein
MRDKRHGPRRANGVRPDGVRISAVPLGGSRHGDPDAVDTDVFEPLDLVAVQTDDELINALAAGHQVSGRGGFDSALRGGFESDDRIAAVLAAWKAEVDADPVPELLDLDTAVAAVKAARPRSARFRHLAPVAAAAAIIVLAAGGVSVGSYDAQPDDALWPVTQVVFPTKAASVQAATNAQDHIEKAKQALVAGRPADAAQELQQAKAELGAVRPEEGGVELADVQDFLLAKAMETPPGVPADLSAPLVTQPTRPVPRGAGDAVPAPTSSPGSPTGSTPGRTRDRATVAPPNPAATSPDNQSAENTEPDPRAGTGTKPDPTTAMPVPPDPVLTPPEPESGTVTSPGTPEETPPTSTPAPVRTEGQGTETSAVSGTDEPPSS